MRNIYRLFCLLFGLALAWVSILFAIAAFRNFFIEPTPFEKLEKVEGNIVWMEMFCTGSHRHPVTKVKIKSGDQIITISLPCLEKYTDRFNFQNGHIIIYIEPSRWWNVTSGRIKQLQINNLLIQDYAVYVSNRKNPDWLTITINTIVFFASIAALGWLIKRFINSTESLVENRADEP